MAQNSKRKPRIDPALLMFVGASYLVMFLVGGYFAARDWPPFAYIKQGLSDTTTLIEEVRQKRPALLIKSKYKRTGLRTHNADKTYEGLTLLQGTMPGGTQLRLIDMDGEEVRRWNVDFFELWPDPTHLTKEKIPKTHFNYHTQGIELLEDGSVIFNIGDKGTAKLDKCGKVQWTLDRMTHHSVTRTPDGGFWIPAHRRAEDIPAEYLLSGLRRESLLKGGGNKFHEYENLVLRVDANGQVLREFSVLGSMIKAGYESELYDSTRINRTDPTHVNDIEVVTSELADKLPGVEPGDILVSIRQSHMLAIMDQYTGDIKWSYRGGWIRQHDPDITKEGNIVVFDNGATGFSFTSPRGSSLVMLDPSDNTRTIVYPKQGQPNFFTQILGEHQLLDNGNRLITESRRGRVFEVTQDGEIVWDIVLPYDDSHASLIAIARRFPIDYFDFTDWSCPQ